MSGSIGRRVILSAIGIALGSAVLAGWIAHVLVARDLERRQLHDLRINGRAIAAQAAPMMDPGPRAIELVELARTASFLIDARVTVEDADGNIVADSGTSGGPRSFVLAGPPGAGMLVESARADHLEHLEALRADIGRLVVELGEPPSTTLGAVALQSVGGTEVVSSPLRIRVRRIGGPWGGRLEFPMSRGLDGRPSEDNSDGEDSRDSLGGAPSASWWRSDDAATAPPALQNDAGAVGLIERLSIQSGPSSTRTTSRQVITTPLVGSGPPWWTARSIELSADTTRLRVPIRGTDGVAGWVTMTDGPDFRGAALSATRRAFAMAAAVATVLAAMVGAVVARQMTAPLADLSRTASRMAEGDLTVRAAADRDDEIGEVASQFNRMADGLEASFDELAAERDALRRFIADASHELRTPITALRNFNELLHRELGRETGTASGGRPAATASEFLALSAGQLDRLQWITEHLLDLSRLEAGLVHLEREPLDVGAVFDEALAPLSARADDAGIALEIGSIHEGRPPVMGDHQRLVMAVSNLVDNALRHARGATRVELDAEVADGELVLSVSDDGSGIPEALRDRVFERFVRGPEDRDAAGTSPGGSGSGLGLAIVSGIAAAHGGSVALVDRDDSGSRFELRLPVDT